MSNEPFDAIVIGAGLAGLCCAAELVLQGARPLLICETSEVGAVYKSPTIGGNQAIMHHPSRQVGWGGGWWFGLTRALNIPVPMYPSFSAGHALIQGTGVIQEIPIANSAASLVDAVVRMLPMPIEELRPELERVLHAGLTIPYEELARLHGVSMGEWLHDQRADEFATLILLTLGGLIAEMSVEESRAHLSVYACLGLIRSYLCGESDLWAIRPNARDGLCIPLARAIEERGGEVWRGRRVAHVTTGASHVGPVVLVDGTEITAPVIAMAGGNQRMGALLDPVPPEVQTCLAYEAEISPVTKLEEFSIFAVLDKEVDQHPRGFNFIIGPDLSLVQLNWSLQAVAPWTTDPGRYTLATEALRSQEDIAKAGGREAVFDGMLAVTEEMHPGYTDAIVDSVRMQYPTWQTPYTCGPKMPRSVDSVPGLYFVGEGSTPTCGMYMEGAASAGILGARAIAAAART